MTKKEAEVPVLGPLSSARREGSRRRRCFRTEFVPVAEQTFVLVKTALGLLKPVQVHVMNADLLKGEASKCFSKVWFREPGEKISGFSWSK